MSPPRFLLVLLGAAGLLAATACVDSPSAPRTPPAPPFTHPVPSLVTLRGIVNVIARSELAMVLTTNDGESISLAGAELLRLESVDGADVEVRGTWDAHAAFLVTDFLVRAVGGVEAMDGVLTTIYADDFDEEFLGYGLRLTRSAFVVQLIDPPNELLEYLGERVWVIGGLDGPPSAFGVIGHLPARR